MSATADPTVPGGVVVVDKPAGLTSHDVVQRVRRLLSIRRVGHAGTLDPMATGVLVVMVGPATKLAPYLSGNDKSYRATVMLGRATTTLDAEGEATAQAELPPWFSDPATRADRLDEALAAERCRTEQSPPVYSAIKVAGRAAYSRARAGEVVDLPPRPVAVRQLTVSRAWIEHAASDEQAAASAPIATGRLDLELTVAKGYYVRALARDLGAHLGLPAHLTALRRTASGAFALPHAVMLTDEPEPLRRALLPLAQAARLALPAATLSVLGARRAGCGQQLTGEHFVAPPATCEPSAWFDEAGELVAIGKLEPNGHAVVVRGFAPADRG